MSHEIACGKFTKVHLVFVGVMRLRANGTPEASTQNSCVYRINIGSSTHYHIRGHRIRDVLV